MKLFVLAGGFGTRLKKVSQGLPKAAVPINGIPLLELQLLNWYYQGVKEFVFLLHYQAEILKKIGSNFVESHPEVSIDYFVEPTPLGTGGAINFAIKNGFYVNDFMFINADTWIADGMSALISFNGSCLAVTRKKNGSRYGSVEFDSNSVITKFNEKDTSLSECWVSAGLGKLSPSYFEKLPVESFSLETEIFPKLVEMKKMNVIKMKNDFIDVGVPKDYFKFCKQFITNNTQKKENKYV